MDIQQARQLAKDETTTPEILRELASHKDSEVCKYVAANPNTPIEIIFKLGKHYPQELLTNPILEILFLENPNFIESIYVSDEALSVLVRQPNIPKFFLYSVVNYGYRDAATIARLHVNYAGEMTEGWHEAAAAEILAKEYFRYDSDEMYLGDGWDFFTYYDKKFISNFKDFLPSRLFILNAFKIYGRILDDYPEVLTELIGLDNLSIKIAIAEITKTIPVLEELANDEDDYVRKEVAKNINTPKHILEQLASDKNRDVRRIVFRNTNTPIHVLEKSVRDKNILDEDITVKIKTINDRDLPRQRIDLIYCYEQSQYQKFVKAVASNPNTPEHILTKLSNSEYDDVRAMVAKNRNTPLSTLEKLAQDKNIIVRLSVSNHDKCPIEIKEIIFSELSKIISQLPKVIRRAVEFDESIAYQDINNLLNFAYDEQCSIETKKKIFSSLSKLSEYCWIAFIVLMSDYAKVDDLVTYHQSTSWLERYAIAQNKKTPQETLKMLATDCNRIVRATAKESLAENI